MVIVITGIMAAGKSTVAQILAERLPRSVHVRGDVFRRMIISGRAEPTLSGSAEEEAQLTLRYRLSAQAADTYAWTVASLYAAHEATPRISLWLDNSDQAPAVTADAILAAISVSAGLTPLRSQSKSPGQRFRCPGLSYGGGTGTRTPNPLLAKQVRYQLRHAPIRSNPTIIP
jgi:cytidylate kinase